MLDETWGLKDGEDNETLKTKSKRNSEPIDDQFSKEFNGEIFCLYQNRLSFIDMYVNK